MTGNASAPAGETAAARARENRAYVRSLLTARQPQFAAALELAVQQVLRDHGNGRHARTWLPRTTTQDAR